MDISGHQQQLQQPSGMIAFTDEEIKYTEKKISKSRRVNEFRLLIFLSLSAAIAILGYFGYTIYRDIEIKRFESQFFSSADLMAATVIRSLQVVQLSVYEIAAQIAYAFPDENVWPNVTFAGFSTIVTYRLRLAKARGSVFFPIIQSNQRTQWEAYAANPINYNQAITASTLNNLTWNSNQGIYELTANNTKIYATGITQNSPYPNILLPYWQIAPDLLSSRVFMQNVHVTDGVRTEFIDQTITTLKPVITDIFQLNLDIGKPLRPSSVIYYPILSVTNSSKILGVLSTSFSWDDLMTLSLPSFILGIELVMISPKGNIYTYSINGANVSLRGEGDLHEPIFNKYAVTWNSSAGGSNLYTFTLYPTMQLENSYLTSSPIFALIGVICAIGGTALLFVLYVIAANDLDLFNKARERELQVKNSADAELAAIINIACAPIFGVDIYGNVNMWNQRLHEISGYSPEEAIGKSFLQTFVHSAYKPKFQSIFENVIKQHMDTSNIELKLLMNNGETRLLLVSASARMDVNSQIVGVIFVSSNDLTEFQEYQQFLIRTEAEKEFSIFLAHEVRNPLSGIDSSSQLLLDAVQQLRARVRSGELNHEMFETSTTNHYVDVLHIRNCVTYISSILNNTLDLSKLENKKLNFIVEKVLLRQDIIDPTLKLLAHLKSIDVEISLDCSEFLFIMADPLRIKQVFINLLTNAYKFTKKGHVNITANILHSLGFDGYLVRVYVQDTGLAIPIGHRSKLFSKYGQIAVRQGEGLGLSLSYKLMEAMHGKLYLDDNYMLGSCFIVEMPGGCMKTSEDSIQVLPPAKTGSQLLLSNNISTQINNSNNSNSNKNMKHIKSNSDLVLSKYDSVKGNNSTSKRNLRENSTNPKLAAFHKLRILVIYDHSNSIFEKFQEYFQESKYKPICIYVLELEEAISECSQRPFDVIIINQLLSHSITMMTKSEEEMMKFLHLVRNKTKMSNSAIMALINDGSVENKDIKSDSNQDNKIEGIDMIWEHNSKFTSQKIMEDIQNIRTQYSTISYTALLPGSIKVLLVDDSLAIAKVLVKRLRRDCPVSWIFDHISFPEDFINQADQIRTNSNSASNRTQLAQSYQIIITDQNFGMHDHMCGTQFIELLRNKFKYKGLLIGCSGGDLEDEHKNHGADLFWSKPAPSNTDILQQFYNHLDKLLS